MVTSLFLVFTRSVYIPLPGLYQLAVRSAFPLSAYARRRQAGGRTPTQRLRLLGYGLLHTQEGDMQNYTLKWNRTTASIPSIRRSTIELPGFFLEFCIINCYRSALTLCAAWPSRVRRQVLPQAYGITANQRESKC